MTFCIKLFTNGVYPMDLINVMDMVLKQNTPLLF